MNEELMTNNEEIETTEIEATEMEVYDEPERSGIGAGKIVLGLGLVLAGGAAAWAHKNKAKLEERKIEKLRKKGYVIYKPEDEAVEEDTECYKEDDVIDTEDDMK